MNLFSTSMPWNQKLPLKIRQGTFPTPHPALNSNVKVACNIVISLIASFSVVEMKQLKQHLVPLLDTIKGLKARMAYNVIKLDYIFKNQYFQGFRRNA